MAKEGCFFKSECGMVLYTSLLILSLLMALGMGAFVSTRNNFRISSNLRGESVAFYLAEAGIEWSKSRIGGATTHPPDSLETMQALAQGTFAVSTLTSAVLSPLVAKSIVRSTGNFAGSSSAVQAQITKTYDLADAALALRGNAGQFRFTGESFVLSGMDHDPVAGGTIPGSKSYPGVSVPDETVKERIENELSSGQLENIIGKDKSGASVAISDFLSAPSIRQLADDLCGAAHAIVNSVPSEGELSVENESWGNRASPQLRCIEGRSAAGDAIRFNGNFTGAGILVVRNAEMVLSGAYRWDGLILLSGNNVALKVVGEELKEIYGSLMINDTGTYSDSNPPSIDIQGSIRALFSRTALANVGPLVPTESMSRLYSVLPFNVIQNYWRIVTP